MKSGRILTDAELAERCPIVAHMRTEVAALKSALHKAEVKLLVEINKVRGWRGLPKTHKKP